MGRRAQRFAAIVLFATMSAPIACGPREQEPQTQQGAIKPDIGYVPTPQNLVDKMLEVARVTSSDVVYDLGCGDGRILVTAALRYGAKGIGYDIDPERVAESRLNAKKAGVEGLVTIEQKNVFEVDLSPATVVALYLLPSLNVKLIPQLEKLRDGARVVSHDFDIDGVKPSGEWKVRAPKPSEPDKMRDHTVYLWMAPIRRDRGY